MKRDFETLPLFVKVDFVLDFLINKSKRVNRMGCEQSKKEVTYDTPKHSAKTHVDTDAPQKQNEEQI